MPTPAPREGDGYTPAAALSRAVPMVTAPPATAPGHAAGQRPASMTLVYIWIMLFGFVGTQLAWTLRPFFGDPDTPFAPFRKISGTFYSDILHTIARLLG